MDEPQAAGAFVSSRLTKGGVSLDEVQTLLRAWQHGEPLADFGVRVRQQGILPKQTAQRSADVMSLLRVWLFTPDATAAQRMKQLVERGVERQTLAQLLFLYKARAERALYAFTVEGYWPESRDGALYLRTEQIAHFLQQAAETGQATQAWTSSTLERTAQGILRALIDGGLVSKRPPAPTKLSLSHRRTLPLPIWPTTYTWPAAPTAPWSNIRTGGCGVAPRPRC
jgi:hypothetical protein